MSQSPDEDSQMVTAKAVDMMEVGIMTQVVAKALSVTLTQG